MPRRRRDALKRAIEAAEAERWPNPGRIAWVGDVSSEPSEIPLLIRGNLATPGPKVGPGSPAFLTDPDNRYEPKPPFAGSSSTGRRLALARWLTRPGSRPAALLARVLANRIWQHHFGTGLAATSDNLGYTGSPPTHPELLEFLADELVRSGWSAKALHRLILTSIGLSPVEHAPARRPRESIPTTACWRAFRCAGSTPRRSATPCSPSPASSTTARRAVCPTDRTDSGEVVVDESTAGATRRSVYLQQRRTEITSLLEVFDAPSIVTTCTRRLPSTIPLQSLSLMNSDFVVARAESSPRGSSASASVAPTARPIATPASTGPSC